MKIVFVNRFFYPDHSATSQLLTDLAFHLVQQGHTVSVVCSRQLYERAGAQLPHQECVQGVQVHRAWSTTFGRGYLLGRLIDYASFYLGAWLALRQLCDASTIVVAKTDPPLISVLAGRVVRARGGILVNWLQDVFPEVGERLGIRMLGGPFGRLVRAVRNRSLQTAAYNVVLGERMAQLIEGYGIAPERIRVIANWSDAETVESVPKAVNPLIQEWGLTDKFIIMYSGNMGRAHEFDTILDAASLLSDDTRIVFLFVGGGAKRAAVQQAAEAQGLKNVLFKSYQPKKHLSASLSVGDVHLISLLPELEGLIVPSKFYGVLAVGRPSLFIGDANGELAHLIKRYQIGRCFEIGQAQALAAAIREYANQTSLDDGLRARLLLLDEYQQSLALKRWQNLLTSIA